MLLNLGCGYNKRSGYLNVDSSSVCNPDLVLDMEITPWPWQDNSVDEIRLDHVLEHVGKDPKTYLAVWKEIWRISKPGTQIFITVPHWRHDNFVHDPTHVRPITPIGIAMFDHQRNLEDLKNGGQETKLGFMTGIDIGIKHIEYEYVPEIQ
ncbi:MAG: methyltransferase protein, partial [Candidatus Paceibacter sp.]|nr:methyltransferase protein [Candidatus Paceibacter sp.]